MSENDLKNPIERFQLPFGTSFWKWFESVDGTSEKTSLTPVFLQ
jgi:hypothetical protein